MTHPSSIAVIGIGSPFGADRLGWQVIEELKQQPLLANNDKVRLFACDRPGTLLLDYLSDVDQALLIDAIEGGTAGNVRIIDSDQLSEQYTLHSSHQLGVAETIALGSQLNLLPGQLQLIGVETGTDPEDFLLSGEMVENITAIVHEKLQ